MLVLVFLSVVWNLVLVFLSVCMDSCAYVCFSQCLYGLLSLRLRFSVFAWTLVLALVFLSVFYGLLYMCLCFSVFVCTLVFALVSFTVCMASCACACVSQCLYGLLSLRLCFSVFVWTNMPALAFRNVLALVFLSVYMDSCAYVS